MWLEVLCVREDLRLHGGLLISLCSVAFFVSFLPVAHVQTYSYYICFHNWNGVMLDSVVLLARALTVTASDTINIKTYGVFALKLR